MRMHFLMATGMRFASMNFEKRYWKGQGIARYEWSVSAYSQCLNFQWGNNP